MLIGLALLVAACSPYLGRETMSQTSHHMTKEKGAHAAHPAAHQAHWTYSGEEGPEHWGKLSPDYAACNGKNQSPIDLTGFIKADLTPIDFKYQEGGNEILNNGHTVQVNYQAGSRIVVDGTEFHLKQFHFHAPSENTINGKAYPMEVHLVHANKQGHLAVVAVMFAEGEANKVLDQAWLHMPEKSGDTHTLSAISAEGLLPAQRTYYRFNGSLTTPPCSEGVRWLVMKETVTASKRQIDAFAHTVHHPNNRPIQPTYARPVLE
jgi:carbonic anhydrase